MDKNLFLAIIVLLFLAFVVKTYWPQTKKGKSKITMPDKPVENDKLVIVQNVKLPELKQAIRQFCDMYHKDRVVAIPKLSLLSDNEFAVTFPYDIDFVHYCFFVNYLKYPNDIFYKADIKAWTTTRPGDDWMTKEIVNKKVMLFVPDDDTEYDNVYLTTEDNIGYKMGFAVGETSQRLDEPKMKYRKPPLEIRDLSGKQSFMFK